MEKCFDLKCNNIDEEEQRYCQRGDGKFEWTWVFAAVGPQYRLQRRLNKECRGFVQTSIKIYFQMKT